MVTLISTFKLIWWTKNNILYDCYCVIILTRLRYSLQDSIGGNAHSNDLIVVNAHSCMIVIVLLF